MTVKDTTFPAVGSLGRLSAMMCFVVALGGALAELGLAWIWLSPDLVERLVVPRLGIGMVTVSVSGATRFAGFMVSMFPMAVLLYLLHQAYELFDTFRKGQIFTDTVPVRLRRIGLGMLVLAVLRPAANSVIGLVLTAGNAPGHRMVALSFSLDDYMFAAFGGLLLAIGHVMLEANRLADENRQIV